MRWELSENKDQDQSERLTETHRECSQRCGRRRLLREEHEGRGGGTGARGTMESSGSVSQAFLKPSTEKPRRRCPGESGKRLPEAKDPSSWAARMQDRPAQRLKRTQSQARAGRCAGWRHQEARALPVSPRPACAPREAPAPTCWGMCGPGPNLWSSIGGDPEAGSQGLSHCLGNGWDAQTSQELSETHLSLL